MTHQGGIGGFVGRETLVPDGERLHPGALRLSSARACLMRLLRRVAPRVIHVPHWICPVILEPIRLSSIPVVRYPLGEDLLPSRAIHVPDDGLFVMLNPFGLHDEAVRSAATQLGPHLVVDAVQALYQPPPDGSWGFASARKFIGSPDGAFLWGPSPGPPAAKRNSRVHGDHLLARALGHPAALTQFRENEAKMSTADEGPSTLSDQILDGVTHRVIRQRRRSNFEQLHAELGSRSLLHIPKHLPDGAVPLYYPFLPPRHIPRSALHREQVWVSQMWPDIDSEPEADDWTRCLAHSLLPLPIDQRYGEPEMTLVLEAMERADRATPAGARESP